MSKRSKQTKIVSSDRVEYRWLFFFFDVRLRESMDVETMAVERA